MKHMNERIVALDIGDVRIGVAVSDPTRTIAAPEEVITRVGWGPDTRKIKAICDRFETTLIVSGLPLNMDGSEGFQAEKVRSFCSRLAAEGLTVFFQDERLSTVTAEEALLEGNVSRKKSPHPLFLNNGCGIIKKEEIPMSDENRNNELDAQEYDPEDNLVELIDENGEKTVFEHLATLEYEGDSYLALCDPESEEEDLEVFILKIEQNEDGEDIYSVPDDDVADAVFAKLVEMTDDLDADM